MIIYAGLIIVFAGLTSGKSLEKLHFIVNTHKSFSFLLFSDVHLDLMYKNTADKSGFCRNESIKSSHTASYGRIGCDTPLSLLQNALSAMKQKTMHSSKLNFIIVAGIGNSRISNLKFEKHFILGFSRPQIGIS